ncbi:unnamed protein product [Didymodactylos carnosus]|uniref:Uncharacterized protein n=1 Tax=Didymodactylos carnosus TaxID=1234261 RepID=A0A815RDS2_9BILA|nr:unnamed protein product [Didymodactylos carnosus]CAF1475426.1 unnamed protein product [Didymodactylos carnosus]CAF4123439.1 unnamed protein product [Didymodactylos carnosus]CAF4341697.1 unnamed protein product [Didymodactylos carnosus]
MFIKDTFELARIQRNRDIILADDSLAKRLQVVTKQTSTEGKFKVRGNANGRPAWYYILVPHNKIPTLNQGNPDEKIDIKDYGRQIEYRDENGTICTCSGWGLDPPKHIEQFLDENYGMQSYTLSSISLRTITLRRFCIEV